MAILTRNRKLYTIRRLMEEAQKRKVECDIINPLDCQLVVEGNQNRILGKNGVLPSYGVVLTRIGASITDYGLALVRQFETLGTRTVNHSQAIAESRDKLRSLQILSQAGIRVPVTVLTRSVRALKEAIAAVQGLPVVLKILQGTQGIGVMLVHSSVSLGSVLDTLRTLDQDVLVQQFVVEGAGRDFRVFVVGNQVIGSMMRIATAGEFRSNIHRGGVGCRTRLPAEYRRVALLATQTLGLEIAGVDLMESRHGPLVIEVNSSPGLEGIEKVTGINVGEAIMKYLLRPKRLTSHPLRF